MANYKFQTGKEYALRMDENDPLRKFREEFFIPESDMIYLDGNSLGRLPLKTREILQSLIDHQWGKRLIRAWNEGWYNRSQEVSKKLAKIIGASPGEVISADSTSLNLYKLAFAAMKLQKGRRKIISDEINFPTDLYVLQGIIEQLGPGYELVLARSNDGLTINNSSLEENIDNDTALVALSHVAFKSAFMYNMTKVNELAHNSGALVLWDLSHAAGAVPVQLNASKTDLAVGCTYKYLNGGPGSPAYLYVKKELQEQLIPPVWGWFGAKDPFSFKLNYEPGKGINKFQVGTPPVLSLEAVGPGLDIILDAGISGIREKSLLQSEYLIFLYNKHLKGLEFTLGSPLDPSRRGSHVSLQHHEAYRICKALIDPRNDIIKVIPDFRTPDNIRLGITPVYTSFTDIFLAIERLTQIMSEKEYMTYSQEKDAVT